MRAASRAGTMGGGRRRGAPATARAAVVPDGGSGGVLRGEALGGGALGPGRHAGGSGALGPGGPRRWGAQGRHVSRR